MSDAIVSESRTCIKCGKTKPASEFRRDTWRCKTCDNAARSAAHRLKRFRVPENRKQCKNCGGDFIPYKPDTIFCCHKCCADFRLKARRSEREALIGATSFVCRWCGDALVPERINKIYCSEKCCAEFNRARKADNRPLRECKVCGTRFPRFGGRAYCSAGCRRESANAKQREERRTGKVIPKHRIKNNERVRKCRLKNWYGMSVEDFQRLIDSQDGRCAICCDELKSPRLDHDHSTNVVRGVLCNGCNSGLGMFKDSAERLSAAIKYLEKWQQSLLAKDVPCFTTE